MTDATEELLPLVIEPEDVEPEDVEPEKEFVEPAPLSPYDLPGAWYVVHWYSGY